MHQRAIRLHNIQSCVFYGILTKLLTYDAKALGHAISAQLPRCPNFEAVHSFFAWVYCLKIGTLLWNGWSPCPGNLDTCPRRGVRQNGSEQGTRASLIQFEPVIPVLKKWMHSFARAARHLPKASWVSKWVSAVYQCMFDLNLRPRAQCWTLAKKEWTAQKLLDCFEMDGLLSHINPTPAQGEVCIKMGQSRVPEHVWQLDGIVDLN
jgi:hypothetical protein